MKQTTYSFLDVLASIVGPGGSFPLGSGAGVAKEGLTVTATQDLDGMLVGADGQGVHSLHADQSGQVTVRVLKTSPVNALLGAMLAFQQASAANWGQNTLSITNMTSGDIITCELCAFTKWPDINYAEDAGLNEWTFNSLRIGRALGAGVPG